MEVINIKKSPEYKEKAIGYYEKFGFEYLSDAYHPWGDVSRVYGYKV